MEIKTSKVAGFTLIEVAVAIALLGLGLMTLTALTSRLMNDTQEEVNRTRASLLAQYILEIQLADRFSSNQNSNNQNLSGSLYQKLQQLDYFTNISDDQNNLKNFDYLKNWNYELKIEPLSLPITQNEFEKYSIIITWGKGNNQYYEIQTIKKAKDLGQTINNPAGGSSNPDE